MAGTQQQAGLSGGLPGGKNGNLGRAAASETSASPHGSDHRARRNPRALLLVGVTLVILLLGLAFTRQGRVAVKTALFLPQILPSAPLHPLEWFTRQPVREKVSYPLAGEMGTSDLYRPQGQGRRGAVLLFLGVAPAGPDDPRVVGLADAFARSGAVVMIPWSERMMARRLDAEAPENLVAAFQYLRDQEYVDPQRIGMGGFCVGASMALVAAADPRINDQVTFVNSFGGYYDVRDLLSSIASQTRFYDERQEAWQPGLLASEVFTNQIIESPADPQEQAFLRSVFLEGQPASPEQLQALSDLGKIAYRLLDGVTLAEAKALITQLPPDVEDGLGAISPIDVIKDLRARVLIMHDREDDAVPSEESRRLADALTAAGQDAHYTEFSLFQHVEATRDVGPLVFVREVAKLYVHMYYVLLEIA